mmetsp:Transcript_29903/g.77194  ORF Transcript_29903/g.77194 Transcript_29903/m.77194 type:complete len:152 (-) Transcript_29903:1106-1561(-)
MPRHFFVFLVFRFSVFQMCKPFPVYNKSRVGKLFQNFLQKNILGNSGIPTRPNKPICDLNMQNPSFQIRNTGNRSGGVRWNIFNKVKYPRNTTWICPQRTNHTKEGSTGEQSHHPPPHFTKGKEERRKVRGKRLKTKNRKNRTTTSASTST